jgi:hypothetical protein
VPKKGLEPPHPCGYMDLNHARLPIPPLRHSDACCAAAHEATCQERTYRYYFTGVLWGVKLAKDRFANSGAEQKPISIASRIGKRAKLAEVALQQTGASPVSTGGHRIRKIAAPERPHGKVAEVRARSDS